MDTNEIARKVLQALMDKMDSVTQDDMKGSLMDDGASMDDMPMKHVDITAKADAMPLDDSDVDGKPEPDEDDLPHLDPMVRLAKRHLK